MQLNELVITVPAPFAGVSEVGFSARYREGDHPGEVPLLIEGEAQLLARLQGRLELLGRPLNELAGRERYSWTSPISLSNHLLVMAYRDQSLDFDALDESADASLMHVQNLVRPVAFAFLRDCILVGRLALSETIEMELRAQGGSVPITLRRADISSQNGELLLHRLDD
ncbi:MAG: hypothetical protein ACYDAY_09235 [Candidatus Dormibacteria bacterium]